MNTLRMNITLPAELVKWLKTTKNASAFIAQSVREKLEREEKKKQIRALEEAYKASTVEERILREEWDSTSGDGL